MARKNTSPPLETLSKFVLRARLVQEHSLAKDKSILEQHASWSLKLTVTENRRTGERSVAMKPSPLLPTEQVESAAARVRPVFLMSDGVHYDAVLDAVLKSITSPVPELPETVHLLRQKFRAADPDYPDGRPSHPNDEPSLTNKQIAGAWLYGHVLHEDAVRRTYGTGTSAEAMLHNATKTVCSEMLATIETLHMIERLVVERSLDLSEKLFMEPVTVTAKEWAPQVTGAFVAEIGTPMPVSLDSPLSDDWIGIHDAFGRGTRESTKNDKEDI